MFWGTSQRCPKVINRDPNSSVRIPAWRDVPFQEQDLPRLIDDMIPTIDLHPGLESTMHGC